MDSCKYGDEPSGSGATELVSGLFTKQIVLFDLITKNFKCKF
jgi:hypothetical protein